MSHQRGVFRRGLVEFVVIVTGVLVALGLESWWSDRQDRELEQEYLASLHRDAARGASTIEGTSAVNELKLWSLTRAHTVLEAGVVADSPAVFLEGVVQGSWIPVVPQFSDAVFEDLLSTGRLGLVRDERIRRQIIAAHANLDAMLERQERANATLDSRLNSLASRYVPVGVSA